jgi:hypothetical protein
MIPELGLDADGLLDKMNPMNAVKGRAKAAEMDPQAKPGALNRDVNTRLSAAEEDPQTKPGAPAAAPSAVKGRRAETLKAIFLWGVLWGIWEATAGHAAHFIRVPGLPGFIMFPAAFFFMSRVFLQSQGTSQGGGSESPGKARSPIRRGRLESIFMAGCIAASIKMLDIFIPGQNIQAVVNPAQAILLESLAVTGFYACFGRLAEARPQKIKR